jgi:hypothetical protein
VLQLEIGAGDVSFNDPVMVDERVNVRGGEASSDPDVGAGLLSMSGSTPKARLLSCIAYGWVGAVPVACRSSIIFAPINQAPWLWG